MTQKGGTDHVCRGGGSFRGAQYCRAAYRNHFDPAFRNDVIGFRLVLSPQSVG